MNEISDRARRAAARDGALKTAGLFVLLGRAGGRLTFTEAEYHQANKRAGGAQMAAIQVEVVRSADGEAVELTLVAKAPPVGKLTS